ncbi:MAG: hypothetical protein WC781_00750 [Candidatus Pacearchaeota archaeon]|jgi:hypothetical protein
MKCPKHLLSTPDMIRILEFPIGTSYDDTIDILKEEYIDRLDNYYQNINKKIGYQTFFLPRELMKNAYAHGNGKNSIVTFGIFLSLESAVVGCNDGGDYFKNIETKRIWENKIKVISKGMQHNKVGKFISGYNLGNKMIYGMTDEIFIDEISGTFFGKFNPRIYAMDTEEIQKIIKNREKSKS